MLIADEYSGYLKSSATLTTGTEAGRQDNKIFRILETYLQIQKIKLAAQNFSTQAVLRVEEILHF